MADMRRRGEATLAPSSVAPRNRAKTSEHRKLRRACDYCRARKTKCERHQGADLTCSNCKIAKIPCKYENDAKPRGYTWSYAEYLEARHKLIGQKLVELDPFMNLLKEVGPPVEPWELAKTRRKEPSQSDSPTDVSHLSSHSSPTSGLRKPSARSQASISRAEQTQASFLHWREPRSSEYNDDSPASSDNEYCTNKPPRLGTCDDEDTWFIGVPRFHGKSSCFSLVAATRELQLTDTTTSPRKHEEKARVTGQEAAALESKLGYKSKLEETHESPLLSSELSFPPDDLLMTLVDLYFNHVNTIRPLLHHPTFLNDIVVNLRHKCDPGFGCVVLAVCAVASRYCSDTRVLSKIVKRENGHDSRSIPISEADLWVDDLEQPFYEAYEDAPWRSAGWKYYGRVDLFMRSDAYHVGTLEAIKLNEVQTTYLLSQFLLGSANCNRGWCMLGVAIRRAEDLGAHSKKRYSERSLEGELWKRALWCLVLADRDAGLYGRRAFSGAEYFDIKLPLEVDDEYWTADEHSQNPVFLEQPIGKPARIAAFNAEVRLSKIFELATSYLYRVDEKKIPAKIFPPFDVVGQLQKEMDKWTQSIPCHLRIASGQNDLWKIQSNTLRIKYHLLRMHIYRCFIPGVKPLGIRLPGAFGATGCPTSRTCSIVPAPSDAVSILELSARAIATSLRDTVISEPAPLCDIPSFIAGATMAAATTVRLGLDDVAADEALCACVDFLHRMRDRWASAETNRQTLMFSSKDHQSARAVEESDTFFKYQRDGWQHQTRPFLSQSRSTLGPSHEPLDARGQYDAPSGVLGPLPGADYVQEDSWPSADAPRRSRGSDPGPYDTTYYPSGSSDEFPHTALLSPASSQSQDSCGHRDEYQPPPPSFSQGDACFALPPGANRDFSCKPLEEEYPFSVLDLKASRMPPYQLPAEITTGFRVSSGEEPLFNPSRGSYGPRLSISTGYYDPLSRSVVDDGTARYTYTSSRWGNGSVPNMHAYNRRDAHATLDGCYQAAG